MQSILNSTDTISQSISNLSATGEEIAASSTEGLQTAEHAVAVSDTHLDVYKRQVQYLAGHENSKTTMDIYAKVKYNKPEELFGVVNGAFHQAIAE